MQTLAHFALQINSLTMLSVLTAYLTLFEAFNSTVVVWAP
jgi:hypothetical protein